MGQIRPRLRAPKMFRQVNLPPSVPGRLFLHSMPGRYEPLGDVWRELERLGIGLILCLAPLDEIHTKSPSYGVAIEKGEASGEILPFPIQDYEGPPDDEGFLHMAKEVARALQSGKSVLIHCGAGIGRSGAAAIAVLLALGEAATEARRMVSEAGSWPERPSQEAALRRLAEGLETRGRT
jgi:protein-tyrosine phosphatase